MSAPTRPRGAYDRKTAEHPEGQATVITGQDWRNKAACLWVDPELFFPIGHSGPALVQIEGAKVVCSGCPVAAQCLRWALDNNIADGVWGGMTEDERRALKRRGY